MVGLTLRHLVAECVTSRVLHSVGSGLLSQQLGCGVPLGCEAAAHATRLYLRSIPPGHLLFKLDLKYAFNTLWRDKMLESVKEYAPELFTLVHSAYGQPSFLFSEDHIDIVESPKGVQQGDPLGPILFCFAIQPLVLKLRLEFSVFYLDEGTIGGCVEDVIHELQLVEEEAGIVGLPLNHRKTDPICNDPNACEAVLSAVSELQVITYGQATLLGAPIGTVGLIDTTISPKIEKLKLMGGILQYLSSQDALLLLCSSFPIPKAVYILRTVP